MAQTREVQWGKKVFSQPPIVQVFPLKKMREACNFHYRYTSTMTDFQLPPKIFYGVEIWRLVRPLQDLEMLLTKPLLRCPGGVFGIIVMLKDPATFHLQCPC